MKVRKGEKGRREKRGGFQNERQRKGKKEIPWKWTVERTYSSITVIARHSTMAGCEAGSRGIGEDAEG